MSALNETPRQSFINVAYVIVLGLLFLSTPESVLNSFKKMRDTFLQSSITEENNTKAMYNTFEATKLKEEPERAKPIYQRAKKASTIISDLNSYVNNLNAMLISEGGGISEKDGDISKKSNIDISPRVMIKSGKAKELKEKLIATENALKGLLDSAEKSKVVISLINENSKRNWEKDNFGEGIPFTSVLTNLSMIKTNIASTEGNVIKSILGNMDKAVVNLDQFSAVAVAPTSYLIQGQPYSAEVFLTASDSKSKPTILVNGSALNIQNGKGVYLANTSSEGIHRWAAVIKVKQTDGTYKEYKTPEQQYQVAKPSAVVNAKKMNVLYIGVDNPVGVSAPGIPKEKIKVSISNGSLKGSNGNFVARVNTQGNVNIVVSAETSKGNYKVISSNEFRVKRIPAPRAKFGGKTGGTLPTVAIKSQDKIFASLENFDFDAKFSISRFSLIVMKLGDNASVLHTNGNTMSSQMKNALSNISAGTRVIFDNIQATGPDGQPYLLDPIALTAN